MVLFKTSGQLILLPTIGFVKDGNGVYLNLSWLMWGVVFPIFTVIEKEKEIEQ